MMQPNGATLRIECLGRFRLTHGGTEIVIRGAKARALMAYLALTLGEKHSRSHLAGLLWTDRFPMQARQSLRQCLRTLRAPLGDASSALVTERSYVALDAHFVEVDTCLAESDFANGNYERSAAALANSQLLKELDIPGRSFGRWLESERNRIADMAFSSLWRLAEREQNAGSRNNLISSLEIFLTSYPLREDAHRLLMQLYLESGRRSDAITQYERCAASLREALGIAPDPQTKKLRDRAQQATLLQPLTHGGSATIDSGRPRIAVLPFTDNTDGATHTNFAQGLTNDLITELARFRWLSVVATPIHAAPDDRFRPDPAPDARYLVGGNVRLMGGCRRVSIKLVDADAASYLWAERFDYPAHDSFSAQDEMIASTASAIEAALTSAEWHRARRKPAQETNAWDRYVRGVRHLFHYSRDEVAAARRSFREAIEADPGFSAPYVGLAYACRYSLIFDYAESSDETLREGLEASQQAVHLDDQDFYAHSILGRLHAIAGEHDSAISETSLAVDRNPHSAQAHFGLGLALTMAGDVRRAIEPLMRAVSLGRRDPNLSSYASLLSTCHILQHDYRTAIRWARVAVQQPSSHFIAQMHLVAALGLSSDRNGVEKARTKLMTLKPDFSLDYVIRRWPFKRGSDTACFLRGLRNGGISS